jgi:hypothetical protein
MRAVIDSHEELIGARLFARPILNLLPVSAFVSFT